MLQESGEIVRQLFDAFNKRDADAAIEFWAPDAELWPAFIGGGLIEGAVFRGHEGVREFIGIQDEAWRTVVAEPVAIRDFGAHALAEVHLSAVGRASGVPVDRTTWNVFAIGDGKVTDFHVYTTEREALDALGLGE